MNGSRPAPIVTVVIAGACVAVFLLTLVLGPAQSDPLLDRYGLAPVRFDPDAPGHYASWTDATIALLGHAFLHADFLHLTMNMLVFLQAAPFVEQRLGSARFALLYLLSILGGAAAYIMINPDSAQVAVGASGAISGVFAAYFLSVRPTPRAALADPRVRMAMLTFVGINVVLLGLLPLPIAWEAHLGGFIAGVLAYLVLAPRARGPWG